MYASPRRPLLKRRGQSLEPTYHSVCRRSHPTEPTQSTIVLYSFMDGLKRALASQNGGGVSQPTVAFLNNYSSPRFTEAMRGFPNDPHGFLVARVISTWYLVLYCILLRRQGSRRRSGHSGTTLSPRMCTHSVRMCTHSVRGDR